ncbi:DUF4097 family beta strand repeat-containing protein [Ornithinimicrobium pekingense]|nr:DUF4097 family beta strand repeat-containing protein [Ornithinimicrobium pekingense]
MMTAPPQDSPVPGATAYRHAPPPQDLTRPGAPPPLPAPTYHRRHRGLRIAGLGVVGLLVLAGAASTVPEMVRDAEEEVHALPGGTVELDLSGDVGDVSVREVAAGQEPSVTASKHWSFREPTVEVSTTDAVTSVSLDCPRLARFGQCYADWDVLVPEGMAVVMRASVGDVDIADVTGAVTVRGSVGDVSVSGTPARLDASTSVGQIDVTLDEPVGTVRLRSSVGDVTLRLPAGVTYDVDAVSAVDEPVVQVQTSTTSPYAVDVSSSVGSVLVTDG